MPQCLSPVRRQVGELDRMGLPAERGHAVHPLREPGIVHLLARVTREEAADAQVRKTRDARGHPVADAGLGYRPVNATEYFMAFRIRVGGSKLRGRNGAAGKPYDAEQRDQ